MRGMRGHHKSIVRALQSKHFLRYGASQGSTRYPTKHNAGITLRASAGGNGRSLHTSTPLHLSHDYLRHAIGDDDNDNDEKRRKFATAWGMKYHSGRNSSSIMAQQTEAAVQYLPTAPQRIDEVIEEVRASMQKLGVSLTYAVENELRHIVQNGYLSEVAQSIYKAAGFERFEDPKFHERKVSSSGGEPDSNKDDDDDKSDLKSRGETKGDVPPPPPHDDRTDEERTEDDKKAEQIYAHMDEVMREKLKENAEKVNANEDANTGPNAEKVTYMGRKKKSKKKSKSGSSGSGGPMGDMPNLDFNSMMFLFLALWIASRSVEIGSRPKEISWQEFCAQVLETGNVEKIVVVNKSHAQVYMRPESASHSDEMTNLNRAYEEDQDPYKTPKAESPQTQSTRRGEESKQGAMYEFSLGSVDTFERKLELAQARLQVHPSQFIPVIYEERRSTMQMMEAWVPAILTLGVMGAIFYFMRGRMGGAGGMDGLMNIGKSGVTKINKGDIKTRFADVAGCNEAKREVMEFIEFLKKPERFAKLGAKVPRGALLVGPPGTGKTLLAKATAGEASVPFFSISGSDFVEMFVGVGSKRVKNLFEEARKHKPCIIFIDEIDAVARARGRNSSQGNDERESTLNQLLVQMDGFGTSDEVVVLGGTNRVDILDKAILRPGRFDRQIQVGLPDIAGRKEIFMIYLEKINLEGDKDEVASRMASLTPGFSGAQIANICNEAAIFAARRHGETVSQEDFENASDRILAGLESHKMISEKERRTVAYHEAGHAVAGWNLEHADPLLKVTIVPRSSGALGFAQYLPKEVALRTKDELEDIICMALGGRAAEDLTFGKVTTGASDDLKKVTNIVYSMIKIYGMNEKIGNVSFQQESESMMPESLYSDSVAQVIDEEAKAHVDELYARTKLLLDKHKTQVVALAEALLEHETITHNQLVELIGPRPFKQDESYRKFVEISKTFGLRTVKKAAKKARDGFTNPLEHYHNPTFA